MFKVPKEIPENLAFDIESIQEEEANKYSHLLGAIIGIVAAPFLLSQAFQLKDKSIAIGFLIYILTFILIFSASTLYHSCYALKPRNRFRILDHSSIYCFISGSYTPFLLMYVQNTMGQIILYSLWAVTLFGIVFKIFFVSKFKLVSTLVYLLMGWVALFIINHLLKNMPLDIFIWVTIGGVFYTIGSYFYMHKTLKFTHFYWHLFVLAGALSHMVAAFKSVHYFLSL